MKSGTVVSFSRPYTELHSNHKLACPQQTVTQISVQFSRSQLQAAFSFPQVHTAQGPGLEKWAKFM